MAWDTEGTKRRIMQAATTEFAEYGPDGTTVERIARRAGVNKERVYNYFGDKRTLFATVLRDELANVARAVPVASFATEDIGEYAGRVYDYHRERPELIRLLRWEALVFDDEVPGVLRVQVGRGRRGPGGRDGHREHRRSAPDDARAVHGRLVVDRPPGGADALRPALR